MFCSVIQWFFGSDWEWVGRVGQDWGPRNDHRFRINCPTVRVKAWKPSKNRKTPLLQWSSLVGSGPRFVFQTTLCALLIVPSAALTPQELSKDAGLKLPGTGCWSWRFTLGTSSRMKKHGRPGESEAQTSEQSLVLCGKRDIYWMHSRSLSEVSEKLASCCPSSHCSSWQMKYFICHRSILWSTGCCGPQKVNCKHLEKSLSESE